MMGMVWLAVLVVMVVIEIITMGLTTIWFAGGALAAFIACLVGAGVPIQFILFFVVSFVLLACTRPFAVKFINKDRTKTNAESLIGAEAVVTADIDNLRALGTVNVQGQEWTARSQDELPISKGRTVDIIEIRGVKLIVKERMEG